MRDLERRIVDLEHSAGIGAVCVCFANQGETSAEAISRRWPEGAPSHARVLVFSWQDAQDAQVGACAAAKRARSE